MVENKKPKNNWLLNSPPWVKTLRWRTRIQYFLESLLTKTFPSLTGQSYADSSYGRVTLSGKHTLLQQLIWGRELSIGVDFDGKSDDAPVFFFDEDNRGYLIYQEIPPWVYETYQALLDYEASKAYWEYDSDMRNPYY